MNITLRELLEEIKNEIVIKEGQYLETLRSFYPDENIPRDKRNIKTKNGEITKPLALSKKDKKRMMTESSPLLSLFEEKSRGDILRVKHIDGENIVCENMSIKEDAKDKFYKDVEVHISLNDIIEGNVKQLYKGVNKILDKAKDK